MTKQMTGTREKNGSPAGLLRLCRLDGGELLGLEGLQLVLRVLDVTLDVDVLELQLRLAQQSAAEPLVHDVSSFF